MSFPSFGNDSEAQSVFTEPESIDEPTPASSISQDLDLPLKVNDDHAVQIEPTQHVDYLSHEWREEDIWASWSYIVKRRKDISNCTRLENASWRQWVKTKKDLKTVSPESLNWLKDCDVTWLYGPLQVGPRSLTSVTPPPSRLSHSSSFIANKKSNLKRKSASAVMLERSRSQQSLLQRAGEIIRAQQTSSPAGGRPAFRRQTSAFELPSSVHSELPSSVASTPAEQELGSRTPSTESDAPTPSEKKHISFDTVVTQVRAVDSEDDMHEEPEEIIMESDEDDDGGLMMAPARRSKPATPRTSFSNEGKTIVPLPPTSLREADIEPEIQPQQGLWTKPHTLTSSSSQETLRPSRPSHNFLLEDDAEVTDEPWQPSAYDARCEPEPGSGLRRTESGMFMPYDDDEGPPRQGIFGQALNAVNTFKDIAHVVWNVGWYKSTDNT
jgi:hypothetical protein